MKEQNKKANNKNIINTIKILTIILLIILVSMIGFFGIYKQNKNQMSNIIKDYSYAMNLKGARTIKLKVNTEVSDESKNEENYNKSKEIIEKRLKSLKVQEYNINLNTKTGEIIVEIPEDSNTDTIVSNLNTIGKFEIIDSNTKEVLLDNSNIKSSNVLYNNATSGTTVYLEIAFDKDGKNKLEEISKTYVDSEENNTTSEENNTTSEENNATSEENNATSEENTTEETKTEDSTKKQITMKIDDEEIMTTSFDEPITTGKMQLSIGKATTDSNTLQGYISQAQNIATVLDNGNLPVQYDIEKNQYILSDITEQQVLYVVITIAIIAVIGIIFLIIKHKVNGLLAGISYIGLTSLYLLLIRYTNVIISIESIFGITIVMILNYIFIFKLLENIKKISKEKAENIVNKAIIETYKRFFSRVIPICIIAIVFCFVKWIPMSSFGMILFWGLVIIVIYNILITRNILNIKEKNK